MELRNGKIVKYPIVKFDKSPQIKYYLISKKEKQEKIDYYNKIVTKNNLD